MKQGRTIQELAAELQRQQGAKYDFITHTQNLDLSEDAQRLEVYGKSYIISPLFHRQLAASFQIPWPFYERLLREGDELLVSSIARYMLYKHDTKRTIRTMDGTARAFLSDRYRQIDNDEVAAAVLPILYQMTDAQIESCEITPNKLYIKVTNPRLVADVRVGDPVQGGLLVFNSEVGLGAVGVCVFVKRLVCSNGMIVSDLGHRKHHIGRENEESWDLYSDDTRKAENKALLLKLGDVVQAAVDEAKFQVVVDKLRDAADRKIEKVDEVMEVTAERFGFNKAETSCILQRFIEGADLTYYGLSNAVTRASNDMEDYDRATELERIGWQIITNA
ncbi:hypothetical protein FACS1894184_09240 [Clostridia bacterium]|nr:hypothetical protein FACS1894184_09240 [Clostridia bacterium]